MLGSLRRARGLLIGATMVGIAGLAPLQVVAPGALPTAAAATSDACGPVLAKGASGTWTCTFVDNFSTRGLNPDKWGIQQTAVTGFRVGETCFTSSTRNVAVRYGVLRLVARRESQPLRCNTGQNGFTTPYTGGMVGTRGRFSQAYGRFEIRAKYPTTTGPGVHGGFWTYPLNLTYGAWPASGELDIAEWWSSDRTLLLPSLHYNGRDYLADSGWSCRTSTPSAYHTYTMEWFRTVVRFFIDGRMCFHRSWDPAAPLAAPQPFDQPFSIILNLGVGTTTGSNRVSASTPLPATYTVDYVKAWR